MSDLDALSVPKEAVDAALLALPESILDEIECVDIFGPESADLGGDSETCLGGRSSAVERPGKMMTTASAILRGDDSPTGPRRDRFEVLDAESNVLAKSLERTEWYPTEGFAAPEGFDCSRIDGPSTITYRAYVDLREAYDILMSVAILRPLADDRPFFPRCAFTLVAVVSLQCKL